MQPTPRFRFLSIGGLALVTAAALAACAPAPRPADPAAVYGAQARLTTFGVDVPAGAATALPAGFVTEYHRRGRAPMTIVMAADAPPADEAAARALANRLKAQLVPSSLGRATTAGEVPPGSLRVTFPAYVAVVPDCGEWPSKPDHGIELSNLPEANYGCAYHRNIGLMLSDPGELLGAPTTGAPDTPRLVDAVNRHRTGAPVGAQAPVGELTTIQVER